MALIVKLYVVSAVAPDSVPVNVDEPDPLFNVIPPGKVPDTFAIDTELVAVNVIVPKLDPPLNEPNDPAEVTHAGASETVSTAPVYTALPSGFSIYNL